MNAHQRVDSADVLSVPLDGRRGALPHGIDADHVGLLLQELNHRIGNLLATVEAVVRQTQSSGVDDYRAKVLTRISGFRDFYQVVGSADGEKIALARLLKRTMGSYCSQQGQVVASGVDVALEPDLALALHLVFHELAMNASKYGALTTESGRVTVEWKLCAMPHAGTQLAIVWTERGGPEVHEPVSRGFGSRVITRALAGYGEVQVKFDPAGVVCRMLIDLDRNQAAA